MSQLIPLVDAETKLFPRPTMDALAAALPGATPVGIEFIQSTPLATWTIPVPSDIKRRPNVAIYTTTGEEVEADVLATSTSVMITFPSPYAGSVVLN